MKRPTGCTFTRRRFIAGLAGSLALPLAAPESAHAALADEIPTVRDIVKNAPLRSGKVKLDMPRFADNANSVALKVVVDNPMTEKDYVKGIYLIAPRNPRPLIAHFVLGPRAGKAQIVTRVRLGGSQDVVAIAELADGSFWADTAEVEVTSTACLDGT